MCTLALLLDVFLLHLLRNGRILKGILYSSLSPSGINENNTYNGLYVYAPPANSYTEALTPSVAVLGDGSSKKVRKVK